MFFFVQAGDGIRDLVRSRGLGDVYKRQFIFNARKQVVGTVTSAAWCPSAKTNIAFASLEMPWGLPEHRLSAEIYYNRELKWTRLMATCRVITDPVFDPERRRMTPAPSC